MKQKKEYAPRVIALGTFNGVHLGHQELFPGERNGRKSTDASFGSAPLTGILWKYFARRRHRSF